MVQQCELNYTVENQFISVVFQHADLCWSTKYMLFSFSWTLNPILPSHYRIDDVAVGAKETEELMTILCGFIIPLTESFDSFFIF